MRDGTLIVVDDDRTPLAPQETPVMKRVRFRTLYERPEDPEIRIDTTAMCSESGAEHIVGHLRATGILDPPSPWTSRGRKSPADP